MNAVPAVQDALASRDEVSRPRRSRELAKLTAFLRRDFLTAWSYRMVFFTDAGALVVQAFVFAMVGKLVNTSAMPVYGSTHANWIEFATVGIVIGAFLQIGLNRVSSSIRQEQLMGTLDSLLLTPTRLVTMQVGSAMYDLIYVPLRTLLFLLFVILAFGAHFHTTGLLPSVLMMFAFVPLVWGLGLLSAAGALTFRRGSGGLGFASMLLVLASGAAFPLTVTPHWFQTLAHWNPIARAMDGMRETLIGGVGWGYLGSDFAVVVPSALIALALGLTAFSRALRRERRRGTLGVY
jgi:ABC-2 type transport system permease protein